MIIESSQEYGQQIITMIWEGVCPTTDEIIEYVEKTYGYIYKQNPTDWSMSISHPSDFKGLHLKNLIILKNPGTATVVINVRRKA